MAAAAVRRFLLLALVACNVAPEARAGATTGDPAAPRWRVIVHASNTSRSLTRSEIEGIYRRRRTSWEDGRPLLALNLPGGDPIRKAFTSEVLRSNDDELATFWNRQYFHGVAPPAVLQSAQAVCAFVGATPGAIGYVASCPDDAPVAFVEVDLER